MQPTAPTLTDKIRYVLKDVQPAVEFFLMLRDVLHFWDDLIDLDKPVTPEYINKSMFTALVKLPTNLFYQAHHTSLAPVLVNAIANWHAANRFEAGNDRKQLELAFVIRSDYANLLIQSAYLVGGHDWMVEVTPLIRSMWTSEGMAEYMQNLEKERMARDAATLQDWYAQESVEYLRHGLTVFNAAMLGETEEEHVDALLALMQPKPGSVYVDMGCGVGGVSRLIGKRDKEAVFYGVTNVPQQVELIDALGDVTPVLCDYHNVPLEDGIADVVMFNESIGYGDLERLLRESHRLLKAGGMLCIKDGVTLTDEPRRADNWLWMTHPKGKLDEVAKSVGFEIEVSQETQYDFKRYEEFVRTNDVMRNRYGSASFDVSKTPSWFWRLRKKGV